MKESISPVTGRAAECMIGLSNNCAPGFSCQYSSLDGKYYCCEYDAGDAILPWDDPAQRVDGTGDLRLPWEWLPRDRPGDRAAPALRLRAGLHGAHLPVRPLRPPQPERLLLAAHGAYAAYPD